MSINQIKIEDIIGDINKERKSSSINDSGSDAYYMNVLKHVENSSIILDAIVKEDLVQAKNKKRLQK